MKKEYLLAVFSLVFSIHQISAQTWLKVDAGAEYSVAIAEDSSLWVWGFNGNGQLGLGAVGGQQPSPVRLGNGNDWADVEAGAVHTLALKSDGTLWAWGFNAVGQLGLGHSQQNVPQPERVGDDTSWVKIDAGYAHSVALKKDSSLWTFGYNEFGQLGHSPGTNVDTPSRVDSFQYIDFAAGGLHVLAIREDHTLWGWGANTESQIDGSLGENVLSPVMIDSLEQWRNVSAGYEFSTALKMDNTLYTWGFNANNQLGLGHTNEVGQPTLVDSAMRWTSVSAGSSYTLAILSDGSLWAWGFNALGQLGLGHSNQQSTPTQVGMGSDWISISAADGLPTQQGVFGMHSLGLKEEANVICVSGANYIGQLGDGSTDGKTSFSCSLTTSVWSPPEFNADINVYPNPADQAVHIEHKHAEGDWTVELYNASSLLLHRETMHVFDQFEFQTGNLPAGVYYAVIKEKNEIVAREKVVISR